MFQEFLALQDVDLKVRRGRVLGADRRERFREIDPFESGLRYIKAL